MFHQKKDLMLVLSINTNYNKYVKKINFIFINF